MNRAGSDVLFVIHRYAIKLRGFREDVREITKGGRRELLNAFRSVPISTAHHNQTYG